LELINSQKFITSFAPKNTTSTLSAPAGHTELCRPLPEAHYMMWLVCTWVLIQRPLKFANKKMQRAWYHMLILLCILLSLCITVFAYKSRSDSKIWTV